MNKKLIGNLLIIFVFSNFFIPSISLSQINNNTSSQSIISGKVTDKDTGEPLIGANVYLSNSTKGAAADSSGIFSIFKIPYGNYDLVVSYVGYKPEKFKIRLDNEYLQKDIALKMKDNIFDEVVVTGDNREWKKNYLIFEKEFLGTSKNAIKTKILNPFIINFDTDRKSDYFSAYPHEIIKIENLALGFNLNLYLELFEFQDGIIRYFFVPNFEEMIPKDKKQAKNWEKERLRAYMGSLRHLLSLLYTGKKYLHNDEGFAIGFVESLNAYEFEYSEPVERDSLIIDNEESFEKSIKSTGVLMIRYRIEYEERGYVKYMQAEIKNLVELGESRRGLSGLNQQDSFIVPNRPLTYFTKNGELRDPNSFTMYGYMGWQRVADMLPIEYIPEKIRKLINK